VVAGDSAGGILAALACLRLRGEGGPVPDAQVLVYPNTDLTLSQPSVSEKGTGWGLSADDVAWGAEQWVPDAAQRAGPTVSPLHATDLTGLPPGLVITAEHDPLRDEGEAYAARMAAAGVPTTHRRETKDDPRLPHPGYRLARRRRSRGQALRPTSRACFPTSRLARSGMVVSIL